MAKTAIAMASDWSIPEEAKLERASLLLPRGRVGVTVGITGVVADDVVIVATVVGRVTAGVVVEDEAPTCGTCGTSGVVVTCGCAGVVGWTVSGVMVVTTVVS